MKAVILAGGKGTRLMEETESRPKPMVEIGGMPILWHIMKFYYSKGVDEFIICLGHKGSFIKQWFLNHRIYGSDIELDMRSDKLTVLGRPDDPWKVVLAETGEDSLTGTRIKAISKYLAPDEPFFMTYGDGVGDVDLDALLARHRLVAASGALATVTLARPPARFGAVKFEGHMAKEFVEKPDGDNQWINAGFFVVEPGALGSIPDVDCMWEEAPLRSLASSGRLGVWQHSGFWQPMDTLRDKVLLERLWKEGEAPWKTW